MPKIWNCILKERDLMDSKELPLTKMLFKFLRNIGGFNENTLLQSKHFLMFLDLLIENSSIPKINHIDFNNYVEEMKKGNTNYETVINKVYEDLKHNMGV